MINNIIFPSSFMNRKPVDEDMQNEYAAVQETGLFDTVIFGYDDWFNHGVLRLSNVPDQETPAVYRGWMMKPEQYANFYEQLAEQNIRLITTPEMYSLMHAFPNVYPCIASDTSNPNNQNRVYLQRL